MMARINFRLRLEIQEKAGLQAILLILYTRSNRCFTVLTFDVLRGSSMIVTGQMSILASTRISLFKYNLGHVFRIDLLFHIDVLRSFPICQYLQSLF